MARPVKSISLNKKKMSIDDINKRLEGEIRLRGKTDKLEPPSYFTISQIQIFNFIKEQLESSGILGNLDVFVLEQTALSIDRIRECEKVLNMEGYLDDDGNKHPLLKVRESYIKDFFRLCNELSLSPQSRAKLSNINLQADKEKTDPLLKILGDGN